MRYWFHKLLDRFRPSSSGPTKDNELRAAYYRFAVVLLVRACHWAGISGPTGSSRGGIRPLRDSWWRALCNGICVGCKASRSRAALRAVRNMLRPLLRSCGCDRCFLASKGCGFSCSFQRRRHGRWHLQSAFLTVAPPNTSFERTRGG